MLAADKMVKNCCSNNTGIRTIFFNSLFYVFNRSGLPSVWPFDEHIPLHTTVIRVPWAAAGYLVPEIHGEHNVPTIMVMTLSVMDENSRIPASAALTIVPLKIGRWVKTTSPTAFLPSTRNGSLGMWLCPESIQLRQFLWGSRKYNSDRSATIFHCCSHSVTNMAVLRGGGGHVLHFPE